MIRLTLTFDCHQQVIVDLEVVITGVVKAKRMHPDWVALGLQDGRVTRWAFSGLGKRDVRALESEAELHPYSECIS